MAKYCKKCGETDTDKLTKYDFFGFTHICNDCAEDLPWNQSSGCNHSDSDCLHGHGGHGDCGDGGSW